MESFRIEKGAIHSSQALSTDLPAIRLGQKIQLIIESHDPQLTVLRYGQQRFQCQSELPFFKGQTIEGIVTAVAPTLTLKLPAPESDSAILSNTINSLLPRQASLTPLLANLVQLSNNADAGLSETIAPLINSLSNALDLESNNALKTALTDSGIFLENRLLHNAENSAMLSADLKAGLLRLLASLTTQQLEFSTANLPLLTDRASALKPAMPSSNNRRPITPPHRGMVPQAQDLDIPSLADADLPFAVEELTQQTQNSLARLELMQLANLPKPGETMPPLCLELPLRHNDRIDLIGLRLSLDQKNRTSMTQQSNTWAIMLAFSLPELGALTAQLTLVDNQLSAHFWAVNDTTADQLIKYFPLLRESLAAAGLHAEFLHCEVGQAPETSQFKAGIPLIDLRA